MQAEYTGQLQSMTDMVKGYSQLPAVLRLSSAGTLVLVGIGIPAL